MVFFPDGLVAKKIRSVLEDKALLASIQRCSMEDTGDLESYHSMLNKNCPKMYGFSHQGMISRLVLDLVHVSGIYHAHVHRYIGIFKCTWTKRD